MQAKHRFEQLKAQADRLAAVNLISMLQADPARSVDFSIRIGPLYANFARQGYDREALASLNALAKSVSLDTAFRRLFDGETVNVTEGRAALHTALRGNLSHAAAAHCAQPRDLGIICAYGVCDEAEAAKYKPTCVYVDRQNQLTHTNHSMPQQAAA